MKSIKQILIYFLTISGLVISPTITVGSEKSNDITVVTLGISAIKKNRALAKQNATNEALKEAVEQSIILMMGSENIESNLGLIYEAVNNHAEKFIITYKIVGERLQKDKSIVAVKSQISKDTLVNFFNQKGVIDSDIKNEEKISGLKTIKAIIEGDDYLSSFIMLRKTLNSMNGIKDVQARDLSSEQATVTILFNGNGNSLAHELMLTSFDDFGLELSEITAESLTIRFIPKADGIPLIEKKDMEGAYISE
ncbi:MAG: hypothetical protein HQK70_07990 [Desulfamplus sp.]|nr:hypothetical protein [Desulfamplus sp.]